MRPVTPRILLLGDSPGDADAVVAAFARAGHAASCVRVATRREMRRTDERRELLLAKVSRALEVSGLAARFLEIEITETAVMADAAQAGATLRELNKLGVRIALDDLGTGYSSLSLLSSLPIHTVKIDRSFVGGMLRHDRDMTIVTSVIALGHRLGRNVVADGVETREQLAVLREHGCDEMQGYLFARPHSAPECGPLLRRHRLLD